MSYNLLAAVEQAEHGDVIIPMVLPRFGRGITHSASISEGETVRFPNGLSAKVTQIIHKWQPQKGPAPNSECFVAFDHPLSDSEIQQLREWGFEDL